MTNGILGRKIGMTRLFTEDGRVIPVTVLEAGPCTVVQRKTRDKDGYEAVQLGYGELKEKHCTKPLQGHFHKADVSPCRTLREFRVVDSCELKPGDQVRADIFKKGDHVDVSGVTKGKGFAGVQKRHGFKGGPAGHGSMFHREPGSIGQSASPSRVFKGMKLPGQMGNVNHTERYLEVVGVDLDKNLLTIRGSVPGANGGMVMVCISKKEK